jgi:UDP:flavonoid glycosyltransferase YjiC (YdhE family)
MRILLCTGDGGGNIPPLVSIAGELVRRGHTVRVLAGPFYPGAPQSVSLEASYLAAGCEVVTRDARVWLEGAPNDVVDRSAIPQRLASVSGLATWTSLSVPWATQAAREMDSFGPSVVLADIYMPGAAIAAEAAGTHCVVLRSTVPVNRLLPGLPVPGRGAPPGEDERARKEEFITIAGEVTLPWLNAARARLGLGPDNDPWAWEDRAERVLVPTSQAFDFRADSYPSNLFYVGSIRPESSGVEWDSPWDTDDERPLVVVSSTTTRLSVLWAPVFRTCAEAIADLDFRGLLTIGPAIDPSALPQ